MDLRTLKTLPYLNKKDILAEWHYNFDVDIAHKKFWNIWGKV